MKTQYTIDDLNYFFETQKRLSPWYEIEKVHQLINNPHAKAMHTVTIHHNPLKFIIMTTTIIISLIGLGFWLLPETSPENQIQETSNPIISESKINVKAVDKPKEEKHQQVENKGISDTLEQTKTVFTKEELKSPDPEAKGNEMQPAPIEKQAAIACNWPEDTVLNKLDLFVYLTNTELKKLGVILKGNTMYYKNSPDGRSTYSNLYNWKATDEDVVTNHPFVLKHDSDTACTKHRWGDPFYSQIDTLLPVIVELHEEVKILWFTTPPEIFDALPSRYSRLEAVFEELKCLKKHYPAQQLVNYWDAERNQVLDKINYLELTKDELTGINVQIFEDSISVMDSTKSFMYLFSGRMLSCGTLSKNGSIPPDIPNMFPTLITDIKGLKQNTFGSWIKNESSSASNETFNTLIPVLMPISEIISGKDYNLVFWYYPTSDFLNALPDRYREGLKAEIEYITKGTSSIEAACTYFEVCKSTLEVIDLMLYPNPAKDRATLEFILTEKQTGDVTLTSISGTSIKLLKSTTSFQKGRNSFVLDIADVSPGIYLVMIRTDAGFKTQRMVVTK